MPGVDRGKWRGDDGLIHVTLYIDQMMAKRS